MCHLTVLPRAGQISNVGASSRAPSHLSVLLLVSCRVMSSRLVLAAPWWSCEAVVAHRVCCFFPRLCRASDAVYAIVVSVTFGASGRGRLQAVQRSPRLAFVHFEFGTSSLRELGLWSTHDVRLTP